jgi:nucleotide-binding universal stress UspA family protein
MFRTIIAGCDGFGRGREAAAFAASLADATGDRLVLLAAHQEAPLPIWGSAREHREQVEEAIRRVRDDLAPKATTVTVEALSPAHALRHVARHEHAGLIVVGAHPRRSMDRIARLDHAMQVLHSAPESVAVVPDGTTVRPRLERLVVGHDGSPEAEAAVRLAGDLARATGGRLRIEVVVDDRHPRWAAREAVAFGTLWTESIETRRQAAQALLDRTTAELADVSAEGSVHVGDPIAVLADSASSADLLVLGSRRWGPVARLALGSTAEAIVRRRAGPVLVLPRTANQPGARVSSADARAATR